jgi:hypothetical protein
MALTAQEAMNANRNAAPEKYSYPIGREGNLSHYIMMNFLNFSFRVDPNLTTNLGNADLSLLVLPNFFPSKPTASIKLPVPMKIIEKYAATYGESNNTTEALNIITGFLPKETPDMSTEERNRIRQRAQRLNAAIGVGGIVGNMSGISLNPYTTIKFKGIPLRRHTFRWKFSPETEADTNEIENIIKAIRLRMHPTATLNLFGITLANALLSYPEVVNFSIFGPKNPDHVFPTAPCVVDSFTVDRTGGDYPSFFATTGMPVVYDIYMSVIEILPLLRNSNTTLGTSSPIQP